MHEIVSFILSENRADPRGRLDGVRDCETLWYKGIGGGREKLIF